RGSPAPADGPPSVSQLGCHTLLIGCPSSALSLPSVLSGSGRESTMAVDERARHELYLKAEQSFGRDAADALMAYLPPVGWADVATKRDLENLRLGLELR